MQIRQPFNPFARDQFSTLVSSGGGKNPKLQTMVVSRLTRTLIFSLLAPLGANAQLDPSSALLMNQGNGASTKDSGLDAGRYTVRPRPQGERPASGQPQVQSRREDRRRTQTSEMRVRENKELSAADVAPEDANRPLVIENSSTPVGGERVIDGNNGSSSAVRGVPLPTVSKLGAAAGGESIMERLVPSPIDEQRSNVLEINVAPAFFYNHSRSDYSFRGYTMASPGFHSEARVWITPTFGVQASYDSTLGGSLSDAAGGTRNVAASQQWLRAGVRARRFLSASRMSPAFTFGADFYEQQTRVSADAQTRGNLRTTGVAITAEGDWPTSARYAWNLGVHLIPKAMHTETSSRRFDLRSGANPETNQVGASLGGRFQLDRSNAMYFRISHIIEKNLFTGSAGAVDPRTSVNPSNVSVLNSTTVIQIGYSWGN